MGVEFWKVFQINVRLVGSVYGRYDEAMRRISFVGLYIVYCIVFHYTYTDGAAMLLLLCSSFDRPRPPWHIVFTVYNLLKHLKTNRKLSKPGLYQYISQYTAYIVILLYAFPTAFVCETATYNDRTLRCYAVSLNLYLLTRVIRCSSLHTYIVSLISNLLTCILSSQCNCISCIWRKWVSYNCNVNSTRRLDKAQ